MARRRLRVPLLFDWQFVLAVLTGQHGAEAEVAFRVWLAFGRYGIRDRSVLIRS